MQRVPCAPVSVFFLLCTTIVTGYHESLHVIRVVTLTLMCVIYVDNVFVSRHTLHLIMNSQGQLCLEFSECHNRGTTVGSCYFKVQRFSEFHNYGTTVLTLYFKYTRVQRGTAQTWERYRFAMNFHRYKFEYFIFSSLAQRRGFLIYSLKRYIHIANIL